MFKFIRNYRLKNKFKSNFYTHFRKNAIGNKLNLFFGLENDSIVSVEVIEHYSVYGNYKKHNVKAQSAYFDATYFAFDVKSFLDNSKELRQYGKNHTGNYSLLAFLATYIENSFYDRLDNFDFYGDYTIQQNKKNKSLYLLTANTYDGEPTQLEMLADDNGFAISSISSDRYVRLYKSRFSQKHNSWGDKLEPKESIETINTIIATIALKLQESIFEQVPYKHK